MSVFGKKEQITRLGVSEEETKWRHQAGSGRRQT